MDKKEKRWFIVPVLAGLAVFAVVLAAAVIIVLSSHTGLYSYSAGYQFPSEYRLRSIWVRPCPGSGAGPTILQVYSDIEMKDRISEARKYSDILPYGADAGTDPNYINGQTVRFSYNSRMKEVYVAIPDYVVYGELAEPIVIDVSKALSTEPGVIASEPVYINGNLQYTITSCTGADSEFAMLIAPEAGQTFSLDGTLGDGKTGKVEAIKASPNNLLVDRAYVNGSFSYRNIDLINCCEALLRIESDNLEDSCTLLYGKIDTITDTANAVFRADVIAQRLTGGVTAIDPKNYTVK